MNLDELRTVQRDERQTDSLQHLRDSFYADVAAYIQQLKDERERAAAAADDPFSAPEVSRLTDEIETAEETVESIYERRVGKVVKLASFAAADMPADEEGLTEEERELFEDLVARIRQSRRTVLDVLAGEDTPGEGAGTATDPPAESADPAADDAAPTPTGAERDAEGTSGRAAGPENPNPSEGVLADAVGDAGGEPTGGGGSEAAGDVGDRAETGDESSDGAVGDRTPSPDGGAPVEGEIDRRMVRITRDVGEIFGVDAREYDLASDDVVTLPAANAEPLLRRDAAERLE